MKTQSLLALTLAPALRGSLRAADQEPASEFMAEFLKNNTLATIDAFAAAGTVREAKAGR